MVRLTPVLLMVILVAVAGCATLTKNACAATLDVGPGQTYATITAAVTAAGPGDTILVHPSTYAEFVSIPSSKTNLVLRSVNLQTAVIQGGIWVGASGVTIDGFRIQTTSGSSDGIYLAAGSETVQNNLIEGVASGSGQQAGVKTQGGGNYVIRGNTITNFLYGLNLDGAASDPSSTVDGNHITKAGVVGIILQVGPTGFGNGAVVTNNLIEDSSAGIVFGNTNYMISHNTIRNNAGSGIYIWACPLTHGIVIECNLIENNAYGIYLDNDDPNAKGNVAHQNNIVGSTKYDVYSNNAAVFDATSNWWGQISGPKNIHGNVAYVPWIKACCNCAPISGKWCAGGLAPGYVGGVVVPTNPLMVLAPYLVAVGLVVTAAVAMKKRRD